MSNEDQAKEPAPNNSPPSSLLLIQEGETRQFEEPLFQDLQHVEQGDEIVLPKSTSPVSPRPIKGILKRHKSGEVLSGGEAPDKKAVTFGYVLQNVIERSPGANVDETEYVNVLESYSRLCDKLRVRPSQKLLDQLEGLQDSTLKLDTIDLKGTRLDSAHCEALEAVLRVVRAQTLNIEQTQLDDDGAISLFEMVEYYEPVSRLIVANNVKLGVRAWLALGRLLRRFRGLEYLDVRRTSLDESTMPLLCRQLKMNCTLRILHLEDNHLSGILVRNLVWGLRGNAMLQDLYLGHNKLTPEDAKLLNSLLKDNHTIRLLDLRNNRLQDIGMLFLSSALEEQHSGLQLITVWSNQITANSMTALGRALAFHTTLEGVNLGSNPIGNKGVDCLKEGLLASRSIARLVMASCNITNEGAVGMAEILGDHNTLIHLDLRENNITLAGVMALKCAFAMNHKLLRLHLDVMKKSNNDELMTELLAEIEGYSVRNMDSYKKGEINKPSSPVKMASPKEVTATTPTSPLPDQQPSPPLPGVGVSRVPLDKRPLPIISPSLTEPNDPNKSFGFFSGHYMKLKQRWDESLGMYLNRSDVSLAASPGTTDYYDKQNESDDEAFVDAVEIHTRSSPPLSESPTYISAQSPTYTDSSETTTASTTATPSDPSSNSDFDDVWFGGNGHIETSSSSSRDTQSYTPTTDSLTGTSEGTSYTEEGELTSPSLSSDISHASNFTRSTSESSEIDQFVR